MVKEITKHVREHFELNTGFIKKFISLLNTYIAKERSQINNLISHLKKLENPTKSKLIKGKEIIKISAETNEMQRGGGIHEAKSYFFKKKKKFKVKTGME